MTLVSAIISTYNRKHLLTTRSLPSVQHQSHLELEIIVVGDGTDDETVQAMSEIRDPRVTFVNLPHQVYPEDPGQKWNVLGLEARNHGLDLATGEWVAPLDDDDEWTPDHVEVLLAKALADGTQFAYGRSKAFWEDGHTSDYGKLPPGHFAFCDGAQVYRNGMGYRYDPACIERGLPEDGDMWDRMVAGGVTFSFLDQVVHRYYPNPR